MNDMSSREGVGREFINALRQRAFVLVAVAAIAATVTYGLVSRLPERHEVYFSYVVSLVERESGEEFRFDGYYALQATDLFAATLAKWVAAPEVVAAAYMEAGLPLPAQSGQQLTRTVRSEKSAPQLVQVTVMHNRRDGAERLAAGLRAVMAERVEAYHAQGIPELEFRAVPSEQWSGVVATKASLGGLAVGGLVLLVGINLVALQVALAIRYEGSDRRASID